MADHSMRLPFTLDPLIAEAKRRMRRRRSLYIVLAAAAIAGLGFGLQRGLRPAVSASAVVPRDVTEVDIRAIVGPAGASHPFSRRITDPRQVKRIAGWFDSLALPRPGTHMVACLGGPASPVTFTFRSATGSELASAAVPPARANLACNGPIQFTARGQRQRSFVDEPGGQALIGRVKGLLGQGFQPTRIYNG